MKPLSEPPTIRKYAALDGWRGVCALLVAALHLNATGHIQAFPLVANAHLFVDFFFVLSGFVVSFAYADRLASAKEVGVMLWRRFARLWPLHATLLAAFIAFELLTAAIGYLSSTPRRGGMFNPTDGFSLLAIPTHIAMLHSMGLHNIATWNIPSWSISAEFWTTAVFAVVGLYFRHATIGISLAIAALGALVIACLAPEVMVSHYDFGFFRCLYGFFIGHIVFRLHTRVAIPSVRASRYEIIAVVVVALFVSATGFTSYALAAPIVFGATVWIFANGKGVISKALHSRPLQFLGQWSYSIYMINALIVLTLSRALTLISNKTGAQLTAQIDTRYGPSEFISFGGPLVMDLLTLAYLAIVILLSAFSWRYIEIPAQKRLNMLIPVPAPSMLKHVERPSPPQIPSISDAAAQTLRSSA